ncbi:cytochrome c oxidase subunit CcoN [Mesobacillus boroniphilus JCM 21738]|uniref:Cytochrome c oxidase subunit CcoN n=2 Tax=Mesobacillus TaxID=2675231 RepID=W4RJS1_9BACI|nr:cytochrome c oxidase subunit CcoN [Mesobacillus boroniphilus JCM 21738]
MGPFGAFSFTSFAAIYYILPKIVGREMFSKRAMEAHFWFSTVGFLVFAFSLWIAGVVQGFAWIEGVPFLQTVLMMEPYVQGRAIGGTMMYVAQFFLAWNMYKTIKLAKLEKKQQAQQQAATA